MNEEMREISARIRELREIMEYTPEEVAATLGVDLAIYEKYESSGENIPISTLYQLATLFKVDMAQLLTGDTPRMDSIVVVPAGGGAKVDRYPGYNFSGLAYRFKNKIMEPMLVTVDPCEGDPSLVTHTGQEFNYVLEGHIELLFDAKRLLLGPGDSAYFNPEHPHGQKAIGGKPAKLLTIITE